MRRDSVARRGLAAEVVEDVVEAADARGRLRAIIDAVRSNRVEDDFSDRWSYAREDFERKLYHKRNKVRVRELPKGKLAVSFLYAAFGAYLIGQVARAFVGLVRARREDIPVVLMALALWWRRPGQ